MLNIFVKIKNNSAAIAICAALLIIVFLTALFIGVNMQLSENVKEQAIKKNAEIQTAQEQLDLITDEISQKQDTLSELIEYKKQKEEKSLELTQLENSIQIKEIALNSLIDEITSKSVELELLTSNIAAAKSEKILSAGVYSVGTDLEPGVYDVILVSGSGNFYSNGSPYVNEIFGTRSELYISEYKNMKVEIGDEITVKGNLKVKLLLK